MGKGSVRIELDLDSLRELTYERGVSSMLVSKAQTVVAAAKTRSPVKTGRYVSSFAIAFADTDRNVIRVHNNAPWALSVEYGGSETAKSRPLGGALDAAGLSGVRTSASRRAAKAKRTRAITKKTGTSARHRARIRKLKARRATSA